MKDLKLLEVADQKVNLKRWRYRSGSSVGCSGARISTTLLNVFGKQGRHIGCVYYVYRSWSGYCDGVGENLISPRCGIEKKARRLGLRFLSFGICQAGKDLEFLLGSGVLIDRRRLCFLSGRGVWAAI